MSATTPVIVLVRPQLGENIGMCARAMLNCGLDRLRLVRPRDGWPNPAARAGAADADRVIEQVECFASVAEAIADRELVFAATARQRRLKIPVFSLKSAVGEILDPESSSRTAILFGPEASGLENEDLAHADGLVRFPTNPEFSSLNLSQAVLLFAWEWWQAQAGVVGEADESARAQPASKAEMTGFLNRLEDTLDPSGFFLTPELRPDAAGKLRAMFNRAQPTSRELRMLHGVLTALTRAHNRQTGRDPVPGKPA